MTTLYIYWLIDNRSPTSDFIKNVYFYQYFSCSRMIHATVLKMVLLYCFLSFLFLTFLSLFNFRLTIVATRSDDDEANSTYLVIQCLFTSFITTWFEIQSNYYSVFVADNKLKKTLFTVPLFHIIFWENFPLELF